MMKALLALLLLVPNVLLAATPGEAEAAATKVALAWLQQLDAGQYAATWTDAASVFRKAITQEKWAAAASAARTPLGAFQLRKLKSATPVTDPPGAPAGQYIILQFEAAFRNNAAAIETITPMYENGAWRVSGYYVR
jgi:hypothetical protein